MEQLIERINKLAMPLKVGIIFGLAIVLTASAYFFLILPEQEQLESLRQQVEAAKATLAEKQLIADNLNERRRDMDKLEQQLQEALIQLPEKKDLEELLAQLNDVGKKSGLNISKIVPGAETNRTFFSEIPIAVEVAGNYHEIALFLQEIAKLRRIVNISNLKLTTPVLHNDKVVLSSNFVATTFRFSEPKGAKN
jgi:type IV pilus assembly protein PilO